jgi:hypothetical protein
MVIKKERIIAIENDSIKKLSGFLVITDIKKAAARGTVRLSSPLDDTDSIIVKIVEIITKNVTKPKSVFSKKLVWTFKLRRYRNSAKNDITTIVVTKKTAEPSIDFVSPVRL